MIGIRRVGKKVLDLVANQVRKNDLFEQPGERPMQEPLAARQQRESATSRVRLADLDTLESELLQYRVINHWATWCEPCIEELPLLRKLAEQIGQEKLLGISWDLFQGGRPDEVCSHVDGVALAHGIEYGSLIVLASPDEFFARFDIEEQTVPQTWVFSDEYELIHKHNGVLKQQDIDQIIALLRETEGG